MRPPKDGFEQLMGNLQFYQGQTERALENQLGAPLPGQVSYIRIDLLEADANQPRKHFSEESLRALAATITDQGLLQPILVRPDSGGRFRIVAGERRFRASRLAGLETVPCMVRQLNDTDALVLSLMENLHREDLTDIEKSDALVELRHMTGKDWEEVAALVQLSTSRVKTLAQMQRLAPEVQDQVRSGALSGFRARPLLALNPADQVELAARAAVENLNEEEIRREAQRIVGKAKVEPLQSTHVEDTPPVPQRGEFLEIEEVPVPSLVLKMESAIDEGLRLLKSIGGMSNRTAAARISEKAQELIELLKEVPG